MRKAMKYLLIFLTFLSIYGVAQPQLGMGVQYTVTPAAAASSTNGISPGASFQVASWVKNKGNAAFSGNFKVYLALDTTGTLTPLDSSVNTAVTLLAGDSLYVIDSTHAQPAVGFKSGGNGNTIVVWPISTSAQTVDSIRTHIFITPLDAGIEELNLYPLEVYPNPAGARLYIKAPENAPLKTITVHDIYMRKVMECDFTGVIDLSGIRSGTYWIRAVSGSRAYSVLIVKME